MYRQRLQQIFRLASFPVHDYGEDHFVITPAMIGELRTLSYLDQWRTALAQGWYHVRLEDHSLFVFDENGPSYSYLQCPLSLETMREFLHRTGRDYTVRDRREAQEEYEQVWETAALRTHVTPIRFDFDQPAYRSGTHPLAHVHIGLENSVRMGLRRVMSPVSFCLFVMRQMYPDCWHQLLDYSEQVQLPRICRADLPLVEQAYWGDRDQVEVYLE